MTDDLTRRLAEQILREMKELHEEHTPSEPLVSGTPDAPHAAAEHIGHQPRWALVRAALKYLEEEGTLQANPRTGNAVGQARYLLGERGPELLEDM